jgi:hypothetical protein
MSEHTSGGDRPPTYKASFILDGPDGREIHITAEGVTPFVKEAVGMAMEGIYPRPFPPPPESRTDRLARFFQALGAGLAQGFAAIQAVEFEPEAAPEEDPDAGAPEGEPVQ